MSFKGRLKQVTEKARDAEEQRRRAYREMLATSPADHADLLENNMVHNEFTDLAILTTDRKKRRDLQKIANAAGRRAINVSHRLYRGPLRNYR